MTRQLCSSFSLTALLLLAGVCGCSLSSRQQQVEYRDPALPMSLSREELVTYLNNQHQGLDGWRCTSTRMSVRLPNGMCQRLKGAIACQSPQYFRLTASNVIARTDLGSNASRCWVYVKPGESALMTWKHQDTSLLQQIPTGIPYIDPNWLMLVLGITPLNVDEYELSHGPAGTRELWLTAIEQSPTGRPLRRVIKVDTMRGVVREHSVYDSEAHPLVRAILSGHKSHGGNLIPGTVKLQFPQMDSEMSLAFANIEVNPPLPDALWQLPDHNVEVVDLGEIIRAKMMAEGISLPETSPTQPELVAQAEQTSSAEQNPFADFEPSQADVSAHREAPIFEQTAELPATSMAVETPEWDDELGGAAETPRFDDVAPVFDDVAPVQRTAFAKEFDDSKFIGQPAKTSAPAAPQKTPPRRGLFNLFRWR